MEYEVFTNGSLFPFPDTLDDPLLEELCRRQYDILCGKLSEAGYHHYEVSNWARPGREAVHNSAYWRRVSYIGLGPGAHSFDAEANVRSWNSEELAQYGSDGQLRRWRPESETLTAEEAAEERIMLALRTAEGMPENELRSCTAMLGHERNSYVDRLLEEEVLVRQGDNIRIPENRFFDFLYDFVKVGLFQSAYSA